MIDHDEDKSETLKYARLLYRSAAWVSEIEERGGSQAVTIERSAITQNIKRFAREPDYIKLIPVFNMVLTSNKAWNEWSKDFSNFTSELRQAVPHLSLELRQCMYDLAYCVATRYRERNWIVAFLASIQVSFRSFFVPNDRMPELPVYLNISPVEKSALNELADILMMPQRLLD